MTIAPYHPRSNGEVERLVETFKNSMEKANPSTGEQLQECLINFLARYRATPHTVTGQTPSKMLNSRQIRTRLDLLHPSQDQVQRARLRQEVHYNTKTKPRQFEIGDLRSMGKKFPRREKMASRNNQRENRECYE